MPELPEVEYGRKVAARVAIGRRISSVRCHDDAIVFSGIRPRVAEGALGGCIVKTVIRRGKYIWFELDRRPWPLFHFGMAGAFVVPGEVPLRLASTPRILDMSWPPRFAKLHLKFDDGGELVMTDKRRLGRIRLLDDPPSMPPVSKLGFDPYLEFPSPPQFAALVRPRRLTVKGLLLDQAFAAGVGNWIADEVLYHAGLDPRRAAATLSEDEISRLRTSLRYVVRTAVRVDADKSRLPPNWLFHYRWGKQRDAVTARGERIEHTVVAGRTTAWVPAAQS